MKSEQERLRDLAAGAIQLAAVLDQEDFLARCIRTLSRNERIDGRSRMARVWASYTPAQRKARVEKMAEARRAAAKRRRKEAGRGR